MYKNKNYTLKVSMEIEIPYYKTDRYLRAVEVAVGKNNIEQHLTTISNELIDIKAKYYNNKEITFRMLKGDNTDIEVSMLQVRWLRHHLKPYTQLKTNNITELALLKGIVKNATQYYIEQGLIKYPLAGV